MTFTNLKSKRREILTKIIEEMGAKVGEDDYITIERDGLLFRIYIWGNLVKTGFKQCMVCDLDCNKEVYIDVEPEVGYFKELNEYKNLTKEDLYRLGKINAILTNQNVINIGKVRGELKKQLKTLKFIILGFNSNENNTIFNDIIGEAFDLELLKNSKVKLIETFPQMLIELDLLSEMAFQNLVSDRPAPIIIDFIQNAFGFLIITDSTTHDVMNIKNKLLPTIYNYNPFALILILGLFYEDSDHLNPNLMGKILNKKIYSITPLEKTQEFMEILYQTVLLRIDQMKNLNCP
ncbi:MAG: hypothetical protein ACTSRP_07765, partial [Candidatus Helarchaeota archaeon]